MPEPHASGFVSLAGRPNAGKSTLLNALVGGKVAITSSKPQTTRTSIQGILTLPEAQIVFLDTPGIHESNTLLNKRMMDTVRAALDSRDLILFLADALAPFTQQDAQAVDVTRNLETPVLLVLTKIDRLDDKRRLLPLIEHYKALREFAEYLPVSAVTGAGLDDLKKAVIARLPQGPPWFPADYITDQPERFMAAELIREKILAETRQEVPHSVAVVVDRWDETSRLTRISATIYVERPGQKAIVIGPKGATLKKVGTLARLDMETMFGRKIFLELFVKVRPDWRQSPEFLNAIDWRTMRGTELDTGPETE
ncbi:MAG: GTPase Era [Acidobacteriota bacterium]|nr:GTPase Era [Acidobacteriota bacterium]